MKRTYQVVRSFIGTKFVTAVALGLLAATGYWGGKQLFVHVYAQSVNVLPYTMNYDNIVVHDGVEKIVGRTTESRRRDGAIHRAGIESPNQQYAAFRRVDLPDGTAALISDAVHARSTVRKPKGDLAREIDKTFFARVGPYCTEKGVINETVEGTDTLFGYSAVRISTLRGKDKDSPSRTVDWRMPEFNCAIAQTFLQTRDSKTGEWKTTLGNRLTSISATEPDADIFTNWLSYEEMKPSDMSRKIAVAQGLTPQTCPRCFAPDPTDVNYKKWHENEK